MLNDGGYTARRCKPYGIGDWPSINYFFINISLPKMLLAKNCFVILQLEN